MNVGAFLAQTCGPSFFVSAFLKATSHPFPKIFHRTIPMREIKLQDLKSHAIPGEPTVGFGSGSSFAGRAGIAVAGARTGRATVSTCGVTAISGGLSGMNGLTDTMNATTEPPSTRAARRLGRRLTRASRLPPATTRLRRRTNAYSVFRPSSTRAPTTVVNPLVPAGDANLTVTGRRASG
jgi:hypothetical protein